MRSFFILLFILLFYFSEAQIADSTFLRMYKNSDMIFTGVLKSKYQLPAYNECTEDIRMLLEFDLTEIQKGSRHMKMQIETSDTTFIMNKEYLVFTNKIKSHDNKVFIKTHSEEVCLNCPNPGIKAVYRIVNKRPFSTIKEPLDPNNLIPQGCGCH